MAVTKWLVSRPDARKNLPNRLVELSVPQPQHALRESCHGQIAVGFVCLDSDGAQSREFRGHEACAASHPRVEQRLACAFRSVLFCFRARPRPYAGNRAPRRLPLDRTSSRFVCLRRARSVLESVDDHRPCTFARQAVESHLALVSFWVVASHSLLASLVSCAGFAGVCVPCVHRLTTLLGCAATG